MTRTEIDQRFHGLLVGLAHSGNAEAKEFAYAKAHQDEADATKAARETERLKKRR